MSALDDVLDEFIAADFKIREEMVEEFFGSFTSTWTQDDVELHEKAVTTVCAPSAILSFSHNFLAYSAASLWKNQACGKKFHRRY